MKNTKKKGVSPVIATVILVAIAIVISIAAAFWMTGLLTSFTAYEKLTISAAISKVSGNNYNVTIIITNDGTLTATVAKILIDGTDKSDSFRNVPTDISPGSTVSLILKTDTTITLTPGRPVKITVVTSRGSYETNLMAP
jgi:flagellin-like protein